MASLALAQCAFLRTFDGYFTKSKIRKINNFKNVSLCNVAIEIINVMSSCTVQKPDFVIQSNYVILLRYIPVSGVVKHILINIPVLL